MAKRINVLPPLLPFLLRRPKWILAMNAPSEEETGRANAEQTGARWSDYNLDRKERKNETQ